MIVYCSNGGILEVIQGPVILKRLGQVVYSNVKGPGKIHAYVLLIISRFSFRDAQTKSQVV